MDLRDGQTVGERVVTLELRCCRACEPGADVDCQSGRTGFVSFFTLPPEINSLRMFMGAGSAPMLQASAAWNGLAAELGTAAQSFGSVISNLAGQAWQGAASAAMAAPAPPHAGWLAP